MAAIKNHLLILFPILAIGIFLRFYNITNNPPGLYWDETVFGYDAYSILKTGKDHHGKFLPVFFESFGDWKLPVYHYLLVSSIAIFGLNEFAVRFPSTFFGVLTIPAVFLLIEKLTRDKKLSVWAAFFTAISPWNIQFSRGGFESTPGLFFVVFAAYIFISSSEKKNSVLYLTSLVAFSLSMYSYHAFRIFSPLFLISLFWLYQKSISKNSKIIIVPLIFFFVLLVPLIFFTFTKEGRSRAISQSAFKEEEFKQAKLEYDQRSKKPLRFLSKYIYSKPVYYTYVSFKGYLEHFSPSFIFFKGDQVGRHSQVDMGQLFSYQIVFIILGITFFRSIQPTSRKFIIAFLLLSPLSSILVTPSPHALRAIQMSIPLALISAIGANAFFSQKRLIPKLTLVTFMAFSILSFTHLLFVHYPKKFSADWQVGYKEMAKQVERLHNDFEKIYITNINQVPYIYLLFYQKYNPQDFIDEKGNRDHFSKYFFIADDEEIYNKGRILLVAPSWKKVDGKWLSGVNDNNNRHIYSLWEVGN